MFVGAWARPFPKRPSSIASLLARRWTDLYYTAPTEVRVVDLRPIVAKPASTTPTRA